MADILAAAKFRALEDHVNLFAKGLWFALLVNGDPGSGKTTTVKACLVSHGLAEGKDFIVATGYSTPLSLYKNLYLNNGRIIVFDDCDSVLTNKTTLGILKGALDDKDRRVVSYDSTSEKLGSIPNSFEFTGRVLIITNETFDTNDTDLKAVLNRCQHFQLRLTFKEKIDFTKNLIVPLALNGSTLSQRKICFQMVKQASVVSPENFSLRSFKKLLPLYLHDPNRFEDHLLQHFPASSESALLIKVVKKHKVMKDACRAFMDEKKCSERTFWNARKRYAELVSEVI